MAELPISGQNTGSTDKHTHVLLKSGKTSKNDGHSHTWSKNAKRTGKADGHTHSLPQSPKPKKKK